MPPETAVYSAAVVFVAYLVRGVAGFGSGLIAVPLLSLAAPVPAVVPLVVALDYIGSVSQGVRNLDAVVWREQLLLIPFMAVGIVLGIVALSSTTPALLARILGGFVIVYAIYQRGPRSVHQGSRVLGAPFGLLGGLV